MQMFKVLLEVVTGGRRFNSCSCAEALKTLLPSHRGTDRNCLSSNFSHLPSDLQRTNGSHFPAGSRTLREGVRLVDQPFDVQVIRKFFFDHFASKPIVGWMDHRIGYIHGFLCVAKRRAWNMRKPLPLARVVGGNLSELSRRSRKTCWKGW